MHNTNRVICHDLDCRPKKVDWICYQSYCRPLLKTHQHYSWERSNIYLYSIESGHKEVIGRDRNKQTNKQTKNRTSSESKMVTDLTSNSPCLIIHWFYYISILNGTTSYSHDQKSLTKKNKTKRDSNPVPEKSYFFQKINVYAFPS